MMIWMQEFDINTLELVPDTYIVLVDGGSNPSDNPVWLEGLHMYKVGIIMLILNGLNTRVLTRSIRENKGSGIGCIGVSPRG